MDYMLAFQRIILKSISHLTVLPITDVFEAVFVLFFMFPCLTTSSPFPVIAKSNMKTLKEGLQPCFSFTNIAHCSHRQFDLATDMVTSWQVCSEIQQ